jgi:hypothetical protein
MLKQSLLILSLMTIAADTNAGAGRSIGKIPTNVSYDVTLAGETSEGPFQVKGSLMVVPCANPDATYIGGEPNALDLAIKTNASAITSGVRGTIYFFTNSRLTELIGGAAHLKNAAVNVCSVKADGNTGRVEIELDPEYAIANPLNLMTLGSGMLAIGKQIVSGTIRLQFREDGTVNGSVELSTGQYARAGNVEYSARLTGRRAR